MGNKLREGNLGIPRRIETGVELKGTAMAWQVQSIEFHIQYQKEKQGEKERGGQGGKEGGREEGGRERKKNACILREGNSDFRSHGKKNGKSRVLPIS